MGNIIFKYLRVLEEVRDGKLNCHLHWWIWVWMATRGLVVGWGICWSRGGSVTVVLMPNYCLERKVSRKCNENWFGLFSLHFSQLLRPLGQQCRQLGLLLVLVLFVVLKMRSNRFFNRFLVNPVRRISSHQVKVHPPLILTTSRQSCRPIPRRQIPTLKPPSWTFSISCPASLPSWPWLSSWVSSAPSFPEPSKIARIQLIAFFNSQRGWYKYHSQKSYPQTPYLQSRRLGFFLHLLFEGGIVFRARGWRRWRIVAGGGVRFHILFGFLF